MNKERNDIASKINAILTKHSSTKQPQNIINININKLYSIKSVSNSNENKSKSDSKKRNSNKILTDFSSKMLYLRLNSPSLSGIIKKIMIRMHKNYNTTKNDLLKKIINEIIYNEKSYIVSKFKEHLILDDPTEFMRRFYSINESFLRLPKIYEYYSNDSCFNNIPNYSIIRQRKYLFKNIKRKLKLIGEYSFSHSKDKSNLIKESHLSSKILNTELCDYIMNQSIRSTIVNINDKADDIDSITNLINKLSLCEGEDINKTIVNIKKNKIELNEKAITTFLPNERESSLKNNHMQFLDLKKYKDTNPSTVIYKKINTSKGKSVVTPLLSSRSSIQKSSSQINKNNQIKTKTKNLIYEIEEKIITENKNKVISIPRLNLNLKNLHCSNIIEDSKIFRSISNNRSNNNRCFSKELFSERHGQREKVENKDIFSYTNVKNIIKINLNQEEELPSKTRNLLSNNENKLGSSNARVIQSHRENKITNIFLSNNTKNDKNNTLVTSITTNRNKNKTCSVNVIKEIKVNSNNIHKINETSLSKNKNTKRVINNEVMSQIEVIYSAEMKKQLNLKVIGLSTVRNNTVNKQRFKK